MKVCRYCLEKFNVNNKVFANHVRWCDKNTSNSDKGANSLSNASIRRYKILRGEDLEFCVNCYRCEKEIKVIEPQNKFPIRKKYFCSNKCRFGGRSNAFPKNSEEHRKKSSDLAKELWKDPQYVKKIVESIDGRAKIFSSKGEREIVKYFKDNYSNDGWTSGGPFKFKDTWLVRDLYSEKMKVCIEYDGIWHFKDIHGQLKDKQRKDEYLSLWCIENGWRLIRIKEDVFKSDKTHWMETLVNSVYESDKNYKFY